jgi:predicted O-methyltransferase YrrM
VNSSESKIEDFNKYLESVTAAIQSGKLYDAEDGIEKLCVIAPQDETLRFSLADVRIALGNFEGARKAIEDVPDYFKTSPSFLEKFDTYKKHIEEEALNSPPPSAEALFNKFVPFKSDIVVYPGLKVVIIDSISQLMNYYDLKNPGQILEEGLDTVVFEEDKFERARRDAEVLTTIAANCSESVLELGTSFGNSAYKLSTNLRTGKKVYTVNILPEQFKGDCKLVTHLISKEQIGSYYRKFNLTNIEQIYENTLEWKIPSEISNLSLVFIDAAHDSEAVYRDSLLTWNTLAPGGFMIWHDFSPIFRGKFDWINTSMTGVTQFLVSQGIDSEVVNLRNSWMGILRKPLIKGGQ